MKRTNSKTGQGMTEYIIIIAIVAIASLLITITFGKQIKNTFAKITTAMTGKDSTTILNTKVDAGAYEQTDMGTFDDKADQKVVDE